MNEINLKNDIQSFLVEELVVVRTTSIEIHYNVCEIPFGIVSFVSRHLPQLAQTFIFILFKFHLFV